jgi:hypothetical protein
MCISRSSTVLLKIAYLAASEYAARAAGDEVLGGLSARLANGESADVSIDSGQGSTIWRVGL